MCCATARCASWCWGWRSCWPTAACSTSCAALRKDNTGYDLKQLFIGAEGTLGIVTAAALKLFSAPQEHVTAFVAVPDVQSAVALLHQLQAATGGLISAFELIPRIGLEMVLAHIPGTRDPLAAPHPWYVLVEATSGASGALNEIVSNALAGSCRQGACQRCCACRE